MAFKNNFFQDMLNIFLYFVLKKVDLYSGKEGRHPNPLIGNMSPKSRPPLECVTQSTGFCKDF